MANIPILTVDKLAKSYGAFDVFKDITFQVAEKQHVALVGVNGAGKSTILRIIAGVEESSGGTITPLPGLRITYLAQEARFDSDRTVREEAREAFADVLRAGDRMREIEAEMGSAGDDALDTLMAEYDRLQERFESGNGYDVEFRTDEVLLGLGFRPDQFDERVSLLSGGQKTRVALAKALLASPDLLLLDEPTNHLDLEMLAWLEGFLARWGGACLIVSHDRYFLDRVTTRTLDLSFGVLEDYPAPYQRYVELKKERMARRLIEFEEQQEFIARTEEFIRKYKAGQRSREARGRQTRLDRLERIARPRENDTITLKIPVGIRSGQNVMTIDRVTAGYAGTDLEEGVIDPGVSSGDAPTALDRMLGTTRDPGDRPQVAVANGQAATIDEDAPQKVLVRTGELLVERGDRIGLIGPNGSGKTTLLRTLVGILPALKGRIQIGANVRIGYYAQTHEQLHHDGTPLSVILNAQPMSEEAARTYLGRFLFSNDDVYKRVGSLSGGERSRLALAVLLLQQANLLVLDEPTNHLDIHARETLEEMLRDFDGTLLFVSHDRYFIDRVATRIWDIQDGRVKAYLGNYTDHQRAIGTLTDAPNTGQTNAPPAAPSAQLTAAGSNGSGNGKATASDTPVVSGTSPQAQARKLDNRSARDAQRKLTAAEKDISRLEARLNELSEAMAIAGVDGDGEAIQRLSQEYARSQSDLEDAYARWEDATAAMEPVA
ncbi:MAG TPA: ABC-F family ATP-binding cassette domain-containing protein [Thermomicrobiales bacterium]|jgi:ATP-binding cassette subfamily F protein 3|nr:ABC-F family ATP-binding cassette domain-containing protein [Thermomicrobiales bacterium]